LVAAGSDWPKARATSLRVTTPVYQAMTSMYCSRWRVAHFTSRRIFSF